MTANQWVSMLVILIFLASCCVVHSNPSSAFAGIEQQLAVYFNSSITSKTDVKDTSDANLWSSSIATVWDPSGVWYSLPDKKEITISSISNYMMAFLWRDIAISFNISSTSDFVNMLKPTSITPPLKIAIDGVIFSLFTVWLKYQGLELSNLNPNIQLTQFAFERFNKACRPSLSLFAKNDILISTSSISFIYNQKFYNDEFGNRKPTKYYTSDPNVANPSDFLPINLAPYQFMMSPSYMSNYYVFEFAISKFYYSTHSTMSTATNLIALSVLTNFGKPTDYDLQFMNVAVGKIMTVNWTDYQIVMNNTERNFNFSTLELNASISLDFYYNFLKNSSIDEKQSNYLLFNWPEYDYWFIPTVFIVLVYMICLFATKSFKKPSMKRRLYIPYLPLLLVLFHFSSLLLFSPCFIVSSYICLIFVSFSVASYSLTVMRYYYLRNFYSLLLLKGKGSGGKILSNGICVNIKLSVIFTFFTSCLIALIVTAHGIAMFVNESTLSYYVGSSYSVSMAIYFLLGTVAGIIVLLIDLIVNFKKIKEKGLRKFFFFDDPLRMRLDLAFMLVILILVILISSVYFGNAHAANFVLFLMYLSFLAICGGNIMIIDTFSNLLNRNTKGRELMSELEQFFLNAEYKELMKEYSSKEMSLENVFLFEKLFELADRGMEKLLNREEMEQITMEFFHQSSVHEVNISSKSKKGFKELMEKVRSSTDTLPTIKEFYDLIFPEVFTNLKDTHSRLVETQEFKQWYEVYCIQKANHVEV
ncbi:hypothetical protein ABK040_010590 [Willaertia magna]